jgi:peptidoglycan hydrolase-like protein with peptidoglycan-binding domain
VVHITSNNGFGAHSKDNPMINFTASNTKFLTATVALLAIVGSACGTAATTASSGTDTAVAETVAAKTAAAETSTAVTEQPAADVRTAPVATSAPAPAAEVVAAPTVETEQYLNEDLISRQLIPASGFSFPCDEYFPATEYPVFPCSTGPLVEEFQNTMNYVDPDFVVDGYFGEDTYDAVTGLQASYGMYQTGIIDDVFVEMVHLSILHTDSEEFSDVEGDGHTITDEQLAELCNTYFPAPGEELNWDLINDCDAIGIRLVSGD